MKSVYRICVLTISFLCLCSAIRADWRDQIPFLIYSHKYFGPNALPIPELTDGRVGERFEVEARWEYHHYTGDKTKDFFARLYIPVVKNRVALEIDAVVWEHYRMTSETRNERNAYELTSPIKYSGDIIFHTYFQLLRSDKWCDVVASMNLKTASGGRLVDARFTDAAAYWFDVTAGKRIYEDEVSKAHISVQGMVGFYCWMTNNAIHRQNDATHFALGATGKLGNFTLKTDFSGVFGYRDDGDRPMVLRNNLTYEINKNGISLRYNHGMKDRLYETYSIGYTRYF